MELAEEMASSSFYLKDENGAENVLWSNRNEYPIKWKYDVIECILNKIQNWKEAIALKLKHH